MEDIKIPKSAVDVDITKVLIQIIVSIVTGIGGHTLQHLGFSIFGCVALSISLSIALYNLYKLSQQ
jgi:hypothetical protein